jgi:hypothetical protein
MRKYLRGLNEEKSRVVDAREGSFDFLGFTFVLMRGGVKATEQKVGQTAWGDGGSNCKQAHFRHRVNWALVALSYG